MLIWFSYMPIGSTQRKGCISFFVENILMLEIIFSFACLDLIKTQCPLYTSKLKHSSFKLNCKVFAIVHKFIGETFRFK